MSLHSGVSSLILHYLYNYLGQCLIDLLVGCFIGRCLKITVEDIKELSLEFFFGDSLLCCLF